jgi:hypothetical protein
MGPANFSRHTHAALSGSAAEFTHPALHPADQETLAAGHLPGDAADGGAPSWEAAWIDLGGEG